MATGKSLMNLASSHEVVGQLISLGAPASILALHSDEDFVIGRRWGSEGEAAPGFYLKAGGGSGPGAPPT